MIGRLVLAVGLALAVPIAASAQDDGDLIEMNAGMVSAIVRNEHSILADAPLQHFKVVNASKLRRCSRPEVDFGLMAYDRQQDDFV
jgi:hypothetical protein